MSETQAAGGDIWTAPVSLEGTDGSKVRPVVLVKQVEVLPGLVQWLVVPLGTGMNDRSRIRELKHPRESGLRQGTFAWRYPVRLRPDALVDYVGTLDRRDYDIVESVAERDYGIVKSIAKDVTGFLRSTD